MIEDQLERLISAMGRLTAALEASGAKPTVAPAQSTVAKSATVEPKSAPAVAPFVMDESSAPAVAPTAAPAQSTVAKSATVEPAKDGADPPPFLQIRFPQQLPLSSSKPVVWNAPNLARWRY